MTHPLWTPDERRSSATTLSAFGAWLSARTGKPFADYGDLHRFSTAEPAEFWSAIWDFAKIPGDKGVPPYLADAGKIPGASFFPGARLNFAEALLRYDGKSDAIVFWGEDKVKRRLSWDELRAE